MYEMKKALNSQQAASKDAIAANTTRNFKIIADAGLLIIDILFEKKMSLHK